MRRSGAHGVHTIMPAPPDRTEGADVMSEPQRSRAVFSSEDFSLIRNALVHYLREVQDKPESLKYANLYHRLGRLS
jgi:hypothetical protein